MEHWHTGRRLYIGGRSRLSLKMTAGRMPFVLTEAVERGCSLRRGIQDFLVGGYLLWGLQGMGSKQNVQRCKTQPRCLVEGRDKLCSFTHSSGRDCQYHQVKKQREPDSPKKSVLQDFSPRLRAAAQYLLPENQDLIDQLTPHHAATGAGTAATIGRYGQGGRGTCRETPISRDRIYLWRTAWQFCNGKADDW